MRGASATGQLLRDIGDKNIRVFAVWEPVLVTDFGPPSTAALARIPDTRAAQYWDRNRTLSRLLGEHSRSTVVWDHIAVYAPGELWQDAPPEPAYAGDPVDRAIGRAKDAMLHLLQTGTSQAAVEK